MKAFKKRLLKRIFKPTSRTKKREDGKNYVMWNLAFFTLHQIS